MIFFLILAAQYAGTGMLIQNEASRVREVAVEGHSSSQATSWFIFWLTKIHIKKIRIDYSYSKQKKLASEY